MGQVPGVAATAMKDALLAAFVGGLFGSVFAGVILASTRRSETPPVVVNKDFARIYVLLLVANTLLGGILGVLLFQATR
jgi:hypothetical protein